MSRLIMGVFKPRRQGGWEGYVRTLVMNARLRFVPNDERSSPSAPVFRVMLGVARVGDAWESQWGSGERRTFYRVTLDDPVLAAPIAAALFPEEDGCSAKLVWQRMPPRRPNDELEARTVEEIGEGELRPSAPGARSTRAPPDGLIRARSSHGDVDHGPAHLV